MNFDRRELMSNVKRIVVKVGSSTIAPNFDLSKNRLDRLVEDLVTVRNSGCEVILVTSGAIAAGAGRLGLDHRPKTIPELQAAAAVGQIRLMSAYKVRFQKYNVTTGMALLTQADFNNRERYVHASDAILTLLRLGVIPIINENDTVTVDEIKVGDNDTLSAYVANLVDSALLVIATDRDGLYTSDPRRDRSAKLISTVAKIDDSIYAIAGSAGTPTGIGGMVTKIRAAEIVTNSGVMMALCNSSIKLGISRILAGEEIGTLFLPQKRISARQRWIAYSRPPKGRIFVDDGAKRALIENGKSLLPCGIQRIDGDFQFGDTVSCFGADGTEFARGLINYETDEVRRIIGKNTIEIATALGYHHYDEVIHRDNLVLLNC